MNRRFIISLLAILLIVSACSKEKRVYKKLDGTWTLIEYKFTNSEGLSYFPTASGNIFLEYCDEQPCTYSLSLAYDHPNISGTRQESGTYEVSSDVQSIHFTQALTDGTLISHPIYDIRFLTKSDLKLRFLDSYNQMHTLIFEK